MLGCWGFEWVPPAYRPALDSLPVPPATGLSAFVLRVDDIASADYVLEWAPTLRMARPDAPLGLVPGPAPSVRRRLLEASFPWSLCVPTEMFAGAFPPDSLLEPLLRDALPRRVLLAWERAFGPAGRERRTLLSMAHWAGEGRGAASVARRLGISRRTLNRLCESIGYPPPGTLLRIGRALSYDLRRAMGLGAREASSLGGWSSKRAADKFLRRVRRSGFGIERR